MEKVLIKTPKPYTRLVTAINASGGKVTRQYKHIDAIAAEMPPAALGAISRMITAGTLRKDLVVPAPRSVDTLRGRTGFGAPADTQNIPSDSARALSAANIQEIARAKPNAYALNNAVNGTAALHASGVNGAGVVVAVIDSGIRPGFPRLTLDGSVVGCEDFVNDGLGCSNFANGGHGTFVAGMISANAAFGFA
jgi:subtilisin family serine protease